MKNLSATYKFLGQGYIFGVIPVPLIITVALYVLAWWYLDKTYLGRRVYLSGGNEEAAASPASTPSGPSPAPMCSAACSRPLPVC